MEMEVITLMRLLLLKTIYITKQKYRLFITVGKLIIYVSLWFLRGHLIRSMNQSNVHFTCIFAFRVLLGNQ